MPTITIALDQISKEKKQLVENLPREAAEITEYPAETFLPMYRNIQQKTLVLEARL